MKYGELNLGQIEAIVNKLGGMEGAKRFLAGELTVEVPDLLKRITEVSVNAVSHFIANEHLESANIGWMSENFKRLFLNKVEEDVPAGELVVSKLTKASLDAPIMAELGEKKKVFLAHFIQLLEKQSNGQSGVLLTNGYAIIGYIQDEEGNFWAVGARWYSDYRYWGVSAYSVDDPGEWGQGEQVLSQVSS